VGRGWNDPGTHLYDAGTGRQVAVVSAPRGSHGSFAMAFTPDGKRLVTGMSDTTIMFWDVRIKN
jgi:WD40 repeat protein